MKSRITGQKKKTSNTFWGKKNQNTKYHRNKKGGHAPNKRNSDK